MLVNTTTLIMMQRRRLYAVVWTALAQPNNACMKIKIK